jgi:apolipoprotein N-acyltransferase
VVIEWTRTWLLSGFPWLPLAASQWQRTSVLQIAAYTGAGGVSFVLMAVNIGFAAVAHSLFRDRQTGWRLRRPEFLFALFLLMVCVSVHVQETFNRLRFTGPLARVAVVQPSIPQEVKWDPSRGPSILDTLEKATLVAGVNAPDFILWPEASTPWAVRGDDRVRAWIESLAARAGAARAGLHRVREPGPPGRDLVQWYPRGCARSRAADGLLHQAPSGAVRRIRAAPLPAGLAAQIRAGRR